MGTPDPAAVGREVERGSRAASRRPWVRALARAGFFLVAALGLLAYAAFAAVEGRYRRLS